MFIVNQFDARTLRWWWTQKKKIDMDPPYQRHGRLWSTADKAFLIDSILNQYDVPKVYLADFNFGEKTLNDKGLSYAIIDGKQRLEAIFDFFDGRIALDENFVYQQDKTLTLRSLGYADLRKNYTDIADIFDNFNLSVMRVVTDEEEKINELFVRLNRSKPLTGPELRNAMSGPVPELIRLISSHELFKTCIRFPISRGQDKNASAKLLLFEYNQRPSETKKKTLNDLVDVARTSPKDKLELASRRVYDTLDRMAEIFLPRDPLLASAGVLPVYYWFISQTTPSTDSFVREFILKFERDRKATRDEIKVAPAANKPFRDFDLYNRSTNDEKSHVERVKILEQQFFLFLSGSSKLKRS